MPAQKTKKPQKNKRIATKYEGVCQRVFFDKIHDGKPVVSFTIDYYHPGTKKRIRETVGRSDVNNFNAKLASKIRHSRIQELEKQVREGFYPQACRAVPTLSEAWERYRDDWLLAQKKASALTDQSLWDCHYANHEIRNRPLDKIVLVDLEKLAVKKRDEDGLAPQTIVHILGLMRRIMNRAKKWELWTPTKNVFDLFTMPEVDNERTRFLTEKEARTLLEKLKERSDRAWVMCLLAIYCGLRFGEIAKLKIRDVDFNNNQIFIRKPKNTHSRYAYMPDSVKEVMDNWLYYNSTDSPLVFPSAVGTVLFDVDDAFKDVVEEMKLNEGVTEGRDRFSFHCLRHTFASYLASEGFGIASIAEMLGQRDVKMARRYTHLLPSTHRAAAMHIDKRLNEVHP